MQKGNRPGRITIAAVVAAVGGGLALSAGIIGVGAIEGIPAEGINGVPRELFLVFSIAALAAGVLSVATARGLLGMRAWARSSVLMLGAVLALLGMLGAIFTLSANIAPPQGMTPAEFAEVKNTGTAVYLVFLAIGVWWLVQFNSREVKAAFRERNPAPRALPPEPVAAPAAPSGFARPTAQKIARPLSITVIGWYLLAGTVSSAVQVLLGVPASIFGKALSGPPASLVYLAMFAVQAYLGIGLLQLQPLSRVLSIYFFLFGFVNTTLFVTLPGREARLAEMVQSLPGGMKPPAGTAPTVAWWLPLLSAGIATALPIYFLIRRKSAFAAAATPTTRQGS